MRTFLKVAALAAALSLAAVGSVLAQAVATTPPILDSGNIFAQVLPGVADLVLGGLFLIGIYLAGLLKKRTGIDIEEKVRSIEANHRDGLHSAVSTALGAAISKFGFDKLRFEPNSEVGRFIVDFVNRSVPEAVKVLGAGETWILHAAQAKLATGNVALPSKTPTP